MKEDQKKRSEAKRAKQPKKRSAPPSMSSKIIRMESGNVVRQYPAHPGYHGSGDETKLNPEE